MVPISLPKYMLTSRLSPYLWFLLTLLTLPCYPKHLQLIYFPSLTFSFLYNLTISTICSLFSVGYLCPLSSLLSLFPLISCPTPHGPVHSTGHVQSLTSLHAVDSSRYFWNNHTLEQSCPHFMQWNSSWISIFLSSVNKTNKNTQPQTL